MPDHREIGVVKILGRFPIAREPSAAHLDQSLREGEASHGAVGTAREFLHQMQSAVPHENGDAALAGAGGLGDTEL